MNAAGSVLAVK